MIRNVLFLFTIAFCIQGVALDPSSTWTEIRNADVEIGNPFTDIFGPEGIFNACATKSEFQSRHPVAVCTDWQINLNHRMFRPHCMQTQNRDIHWSRSSFQKDCSFSDSPAGDLNKRCALQGRRLSRFQYLNVYSHGRYLFTKGYMIPLCWSLEQQLEDQLRNPDEVVL